MNKELKQVIKSRTKAKTRSLERESLGPLRQGQRLNTTETKCSQHRLLKVRQKRLDTIGKWAKQKACSGDTKSSQSMNASSPEQMHANSSSPPELSIPFFLPHDTKLSPLLYKVHLIPCYELETQFAPLLVTHESSQNENMQPIASQIDKIQHKMLHMSKRASLTRYSFVWTWAIRSLSFTTIDQS
jgi:hypothetical protein